ncbi:MAG: glycosyltransferase family 4 protein [Cyclobacteriaceae bacterium]
MNILVFSRTFYPNIGGVEKVAQILADQFLMLGHKVIVVTETELRRAGELNYKVYRKINFIKKYQLLKECDVVLMHGLSLNDIPLKLISRKPFFVVHHTWYQRNLNGKKSLQDVLKLLLTHLVQNISVSQVVAKHIYDKKNHVVIHNPYEDHIFFNQHERREKDLVFVGRLVSDKGCDLLLDVLLILKDQDLYPKLSIIGEGPEKPNLIEMVQKYGLQHQVSFLGIRQGKELSGLLNQHKIMVVPSRWAEPFGIVALEGLASGCQLIVPDHGGLQEAIGQEGLIFANNQAASLAEAIRNALLEKKPKNDDLRQHLQSFEARQVAGRYLDLFERSLMAK